MTSNYDRLAEARQRARQRSIEQTTRTRQLLELLAMSLEELEMWVTLAQLPQEWE